MNKILNFIREARVELSKVNWPTWDRALRLTLAVILISGIVSLAIFAMDLVIGRAVRQGIVSLEILKQRQKERQTSSPVKVREPSVVIE